MRSFDLAQRPIALLIVLLFLLANSAILSGKHAPRRIEVKIEDLKFKPASVEVGPGDTVVWVNDDDTDHDVKSDDGSFNSGRLAAGHSFEHKFDKAGKFDYHDDLHPRMHGAVTVSDH